VGIIPHSILYPMVYLYFGAIFWTNLNILATKVGGEKNPILGLGAGEG
jgi:hypothetical protein